MRPSSMSLSVGNDEVSIYRLGKSITLWCSLSHALEVFFDALTSDKLSYPCFAALPSGPKLRPRKERADISKDVCRTSTPYLRPYVQ